jgi:hypothetical protein
MLLAPKCTSELLIAPKTHFAQLNSLCDISKQTFQVDQTFNIYNVKVMFCSHVVDALLHTYTLLITKQTDT